MTSTRGRAAVAPLIAMVAFFALILLPPHRVNADRGTRRVAIVVVVHPKSSLTGVSLRDLRQLFGGDEDSSSRIPLNFTAGSATRSAFDAAVFRMSSREVGRYWVDREVRGESGPPRSFASALTITKLVGKFPQAIGYVRADEMPGWVKPLKIGGTAHTDPGYPLFVEVPE